MTGHFIHSFIIRAINSNNLYESATGVSQDFSSFFSFFNRQNVVLSGLKYESLKGRHVLVIEDILDTGTTLAFLIPELQKRAQPSSIVVCTLLDKRLDEGRVKKFTAKYVGFSIPNHFIIGYGLDYNELYRDLKDIFIISKAGIDFDSSTLLM